MNNVSVHTYYKISTTTSKNVSGADFYKKTKEREEKNEQFLSNQI